MITKTTYFVTAILVVTLMPQNSQAIKISNQKDISSGGWLKRWFGWGQGDGEQKEEMNKQNYECIDDSKERQDNDSIPA